MSNYTYPNTTRTFGARDALPANDDGKRVSGTALDEEFLALEASSATKLNKNNPSFTGTMTGGGTVDGGAF